MSRRVIFAVAVLLIAVTAALTVANIISDRPKEGDPALSMWRVVGVVDGDTILVRPYHGSATVTVRLIGIDTPETVDPAKPVECFGPEARALTAELEGSDVYLEFDERHFDDFGRLLAYVYTEEGANWSVVLASAGAGRPLNISPNDRHAAEIAAASARAERRRFGLWGRC